MWARVEKVMQRMSDFNKIYPKTVAVKIFMNFSEKSKSFYSARDWGWLSMEVAGFEWERRVENGFLTLIKIRFD